MKIGVVHLLGIVISAAVPVRTATAAETAPGDPSPLAPEAEKAAAHGRAVSQDLEPGQFLTELIPLGPPTGARDELTLSPSAPASAVPEPATLAVFGVGLLLLFRRRSAS